MTMTYFVWQNNCNVDNDLRALNRGQGLRVAYTFLTKRRREKLQDSFGVSENTWILQTAYLVCVHAS